MRRVLLILSTTLLVILLLLAGNLLVQGAWSETPRRKDGASSIGTTMIGPGNITASHLAAEPISTSFTYQGTLSDNGQPAEGTYDFLFALYPSLEGGAQVGSSVEVNDFTVSDGLFTVLLDFEQGLVLFDGTAYWLEIRVRPGAETGTHTILAPRQALTPTPNAIYASRADWDGLLNAPPGFVDGVDNDTLATLACADGLIAQAIGNGWQCANEEGDISGIDAGTGLSGGGDSGLISLELLAGQVLPQNCENGEIVEWTGSIWRCSQDDVGESGGGGDITGVLAGFGLEGGGESGTVTLDVLSTTMQSRVNGTCPDGSTIQSINQDGSVNCQVDSDTTYTAGIGLDLNGLTFTITSANRLPQDCGAGEIARWDDDGQIWFCDADLDTTDDQVSFDEIAAIVGTASGTVAGGDHNHDTDYALSVHNHDGRYFTQTALINGTAQVDWANLRTIPTSLADGDDDSLAGLSCADDQIVKRAGGLWACGTDEVGSGGNIGDITAVYGGAGLTGGAEINEVTLDVGAGAGLTVTADAVAIVGSYQLPQDCGGGQIISWNGEVWSCANPGSGGTGWSLTGNAGTTAGTNFLGTTDDQALELHVNNLRALLLVPNITSTNIVAGFWANNAEAGIGGATIGGGGSDLNPNSVAADFGLVAGGLDNTAAGFASAIGGGESNLSSGSQSVVAGGQSNNAAGEYANVAGGRENESGGSYATIGGGKNNETGAGYAVVGGGLNNLVTNTLGIIAGGSFNSVYGSYDAIGGGSYNDIYGDYGTIAGGGPSDTGNPITSRNQVLDDYGVIGGGGGNTAGSNTEEATFATVSGGQTNTAEAIYATVSGGLENSASGDGATVAGGSSNDATNHNAVVAGGSSNSTSGENAAIVGGQSNSAGGSHANVGGGQDNSASGSHANIGGGQNNVISATHSVVAGGMDNLITDTYSAIAGGSANSVYGSYAAISGGNENDVFADYATVGGGGYNMVTGDYGTIAGGGPQNPSNPTTSRNQVLDDYGFIGGGGGNTAGSNFDEATFATVSGGQTNTAEATNATVSGGQENSASGYGASVGGGTSNEATGNYAVIAGGIGNDATGENSSIAGGSSNSTSGTSSTVGGGLNNEVAAEYGTIPGGRMNYVSGTSGFAAGFQARAEHQGSFVWSDSTGGLSSTANDQFLIDASGGVGIGTNNTNPTNTLSVGGNTVILGDGRLVARGVVTGTDEFKFIKGFQKPSAVAAAGDYIYVTAASTNTLTIIDVSDPDQPRPIAYTTSGLHQPVDIQVAGGLAYIASELNNSLVIIDVSHPHRSVIPGDPTIVTDRLVNVGSADRHLAKPQAVHVTGNHAYVASLENNSLVIFDVSDPAEPLEVGFTNANLGWPSDVYVAGEYAYVTSLNNDSLAIFNISTSNTSSDTINIESRDVYADVYLLDGPRAVEVRGSYAYVLAENSGMLTVLDISNSEVITYTGHIFTNLTHPVDLFLSGDYAYVAYAGESSDADNSGLAVFDVSDPANIQVLSEIDMSDSDPLPEKPVAIAGNGRHIYVANENHHSVSVYDINYLEAPAITAGTVQAGELESMGDARVNNNLSVGDGLNVGPGGALIEGQLSVAGRENSYILGQLSLGAAGIVYSDSEKTQIIYPTQQLDVHGDARFRVNENHSLMLASPPEKGTFLDFTTNNFGAYYTPTARIEFAVPDPFTGTTHTTEVKILTQSESDTEVRGRMTIGEEIIFHNVDQDDPDLRLRTTITVTKNGDVLPGMDNAYFLGDPTHRWDAVYSEGGVIETSDERWKDDVSDLAYGLDEVKQLRPVSYSWREDPAGEMHYGLIAQEVLDVLPEMVDLGQDPDDPLGLNYAELTPVLVSAIQEQQEQIESQADQIATLEERLTALEGSGNNLLSGFNTLWGGVLVGVAMVAVGSRRWLGRRP